MRSKDFLGKGATAQKPAPPKGGADKRANCDAVGYTLLISLFFPPYLLPKFSPATAGDIDCNLSLFHLQKDDKKAADIFSYHRLKTQVLSFNFRYIKHLRFVSVDKKIRAISVALNRLVLRTDFNPDY